MFRTIFCRNTADAGGLAVSLLTSAIAILDVQLLAAMVLCDNSRYYRAAMLDMLGGPASLGSSFVGMLILSAGFALNLFVIMFLYERQVRKGVSRIDRVLYRLIMPSGFVCTLVLAARAVYLAVYPPV